MKLRVFILLLFSISLLVNSQTQLTNIPTFYITTQNSAPVTSKVIYVPGFLTVVSKDSTESFTSDSIEIRGRGNSTWNLAKKPYRIKFENKRKLLNLPAKAKNWILLANHSDKTLIRNAVAFEIGNYLNMEFTPSVKFADVVLNGKYIGNYMITDQVEVGGDRVEVEKQDSTDTTEPNISGGYLLEIDGFASLEPLWYTTSKGLKITVKYPDDENVNQQQIDYIKNFTNTFENTLFSGTYADPLNGFRSMIDTTSFIDWFIASELTGNPDCFWSTFIYKKRDIPKFFYGPLWDYDIAFNNERRLGDVLNKRMLQYAFENKTWITKQATDKWFLNKVNQRWTGLLKKGIIEHLQNYVDSIILQIDESQKANFQKWPVLKTRVYNEQFLFPTYGEGVDFLKKYITDRATFLTTSFAKDVPIVPGIPFVSENFYYMVMNKQAGNVIDITEQSSEINTKLMLWNPIEGRLTQHWKILPLSESKYQFINRFSGLAMKGAGSTNNFVQVNPDSTQTEQQWKIVPELNGTSYRIDNVYSGLTADCSGGSTANGAAVIEYEIKTSGSDNQYWYIQKVEKLETSLLPSQNPVTLIMYPNPVSDILYVSSHEGLTNGTLLEVVSPQGKTLIRQRTESTDSRIDVSSLSEGLYLLKVSVGNSQYSKKFVKK